ncbi:MAG: hypothetical protein NVV60_10305 [Luteimonas sp.]|nr:hypothetical protein [Luteimonas sp.]
MTRWKAAATHLAISILVIGGLALAIYLLWYPMGLYHLAGQDRIVLVMLGIDIAAGPLLTLVVYKAGKKTLKFDLTVIALCQAALLAWGLHTLWQTRPVFLLATPDRFTLLFANDIDPRLLADAPKPEWRRFSWTGPQLVATAMPTDPDRRREAMDQLMSGGAGIERTPQWYVEFEHVAQDIIRNSRRINADAPVAAADIKSTGHDAAHLRWLPIGSRFGDARMLIDPTTGQPLRVAR